MKGISELITVHSDGNINLDFRDVETTLRNGGGAIMAMGRASGDHRVERAIIDALDSPLLYGNDIGRAKRILFNIYGSESCPIIINEMQDIDDFFDQLDPNIEVIWGTSTDDDDDDILGSNGRKKAMEEKDDEYFESLIPLLYKSRKKDKKPASEATESEQQPVPSAEMSSQQSDQPIPDDEHPSPSQTPPPLPIEKEEEPRPIEKEPDKPEPGQSKATPQPSIIDKWKSWLIEKTGPFLQEDE